ncbi:MAG: nucleoside-diphosphate kinase [Candidatus Firestonebacteria bacterium]|nr:nucleoside-diphosphate kinase [Candidatus Firestonebacteria bacterium]
MALQKTLTIIKPDAVSRKLIGEIIHRFENNGFRISGIKILHMDKNKSEGFYVVHKERPFFKDLVSFMISGPSVVIVLESEDAINRLRKLMGATNPENAEMGTIRRELASSIEKNVVHGSDSLNSAEFEINYFFNTNELI